MISYKGERGFPVACGWEQPGRTHLHGHRVPPGHVCVQLTQAHPNLPAPVILGDPTENSILRSGEFFALPTARLQIPTMVDGAVCFLPYS